jgi:hypothetical protein
MVALIFIGHSIISALYLCAPPKKAPGKYQLFLPSKVGSLGDVAGDAPTSVPTNIWAAKTNIAEQFRTKKGLTFPERK